MLFAPKKFAFAGLSSLLFADNVLAFWRMPCLSRSGLARLDPLVSPNSVSEHMHAIHGSSGFSSTSGWAELTAGDCTSCQVAQDKSAYWTPALYFQDASTKQFELVTQEGGMLAYYLLYPNADDPTNTVHAFPEGFRMIAGSTNVRNFSNYPVPDIQKSDWTGVYTTQAFLEQAALGFNCLNYAIAPEGSLYRHFLPDKAYLDANCKDGVRFELMFPSCWNGAVNSTNNKDHVAYPSEVMTGNCPPDFPKRLVSLFYETIWRTEDFVGRDGEFVIANGDPTGYGYHGDFIMGWDGTFLQDAVNQCTNPSGQIEDCPLFNIQEASVYSSCSISTPSTLVAEAVSTGLASLPGNPPIVSGPEPADGATAGAPAATTPVATTPAAASSPPAAPSLSYSAGSSLATSATYVPGAVFAADTSASAPAITAAPAVENVAQVPVSYFSTDYSTNGLTVNEVLWVEDIVTVTVPYAARKRHLHKHRGVGI